MNGIFSVLGSVAVVIVSMASNFTIAMACAMLFYGTAAAMSASIWQPAHTPATAATTATEGPLPAQ
jgi:hypothetical protein